MIKRGVAEPTDENLKAELKKQRANFLKLEERRKKKIAAAEEKIERLKDKLKK